MSSDGKPPPFNPAWNPGGAVLKTDALSQEVQIHIANVFAALACTLLACTLGVMAHLQTGCGGALSGIAFILTFLLLAIDTQRNNGPRRFGILLLLGLLQGMSLGELVQLALLVDPSIVMVASLGTSVVFAAFSGAALVARRRSYLYLGATLSSMVTLMSVAGIANIWLRSPLLMDANLYIGLLVFCGYVIYDTQLIIERAAAGSRDFAWHAAELFIDFISIFVRILVIMLKNAAKHQQNSNGNSERRDSRSNSTATKRR